MERKKLLKLIKQIQNGKEKKFEIILENYGKRLYGYIYNLSKDNRDVDDLYQETILKVFRSLSQFKTDMNFEAWMIRIARNTVIDNYRKQKKIIYLDDINEPSSEMNLEADYIEKERLIEIDAMINELSEDERTLIYMKYFNRMSYEEMAGKLDTEIKTVKWKLYAARQKLVKNNELRRLHDEM